ncbi:hypothetical protein Tco_0808504 [Tanacetum coccineum]
MTMSSWTMGCYGLTFTAIHVLRKYSMSHLAPELPRRLLTYPLRWYKRWSVFVAAAFQLSLNSLNKFAHAHNDTKSYYKRTRFKNQESSRIKTKGLPQTLSYELVGLELESLNSGVLKTYQEQLRNRLVDLGNQRSRSEMKWDIEG